MHSESSRAAAGTLYVVATPIGNLRDLTLRALDVLATVDRIAAEDTRHSRRLLDAHGITGKLVPVHEHNERTAAERVVTWLGEGESVALITDAGTPGISDPGALVVRAVRAAGHRVVPVPGASAVTAAVSVAGLAGHGFEFAGFLPPRAAARRKALAAFVDCDHPVVFYEAPHRIRETLDDLVATFPPQTGLTLCRELTKLFEEVGEVTVGTARGWLDAEANRERGEYVLIVHASVRDAAATDEAGARIVGVLARELPASQAARLAAELSGARRSDLYDVAMRMKGSSGEADDE
ncbi:MAG: 16S rRNA (cytidine(1402)-2'-O)-methyltransferase [Betaproteobacteria bacterium]|nr:16S rRNA (cytidine(1402)-2'-O)-methyltransferase [Betaproteobacteria bacterium]